MLCWKRSLLDKILSEKELSHTNLCLLIEKIIIYEDEYELRLEILMKAPFLEKSYTDEIGMICEDNYEEVSAWQITDTKKAYSQIL